ncbi:MAG: ribokinase [Caulobacter sp.]|nr:ribokinase [Caulobacter sp.]
MSSPLITVVGSINLDFVATAKTLPSPGETVTGATLARYPGGKGANQALAAKRLGADVRMIGRVGADSMADEALALLKAGGVDLTGVGIDASAPTGAALLAVSEDGENQIVVASGANHALRPEHLPAVIDGALILQLEIPFDTIAAAAERASGFVCVNLAPAAEIPDVLFERADLLIANELEADFYGPRLHRGGGLVAVTWGSRGAGLFRDGARLATAEPPEIVAVDTTGAGDTFVAALTVALLEGQAPKEALAFACTAGALTATRAGAQPSLPTRPEVEGVLASGRTAP